MTEVRSSKIKKEIVAWVLTGEVLEKPHAIHEEEGQNFILKADIALQVLLVT